MGWGGTERREKEGKIRRSSASPRSCSSFAASLGFSISPHVWDGHLKLPSWDGASELLWCRGTAGLTPPIHRSILLIKNLEAVSAEQRTDVTASSFLMSVLTGKTRA